MITGNTTNAFLIMENVEEGRENELKQAISMIVEYAEKYLSATVETFFVTAENPSILL